MALDTRLPMMIERSSVKDPLEIRGEIATVRGQEADTRMRDMQTEMLANEMAAQKEMQKLYEETGGDLDKMQEALWKIDPNTAMEFGRFKDDMRRRGFETKNAEFDQERTRLNLYGQIAQGVTSPETHAQVMEQYRDNPEILEAIGQEYDPDRITKMKTQSMTQYENLMENHKAMQMIMDGTFDQGVGTALSAQGTEEDWDETLESLSAYVPKEVLDRYRNIDPTLDFETRKRIAADMTMTPQERQAQRSREEANRLADQRYQQERRANEIRAFEAETAAIRAETDRVESLKPGGSDGDMTGNQRSEMIIDRQEKRAAFQAQEAEIPPGVEGREDQLKQIARNRYEMEVAYANALGEDVRMRNPDLPPSRNFGPRNEQVPPAVLRHLMQETNSRSIAYIPEGEWDLEGPNGETVTYVSDGGGQIYRKQ